MNILVKSGDMNMAELYRLTKSPEIAKLTSVKGHELDLAKFIVYEDANLDGVATVVAAFETVDGELFATNSPTFTRDFLDIISMCKEANAEYPRRIKVFPKVGKSGREYIQCVYIG